MADVPAAAAAVDNVVVRNDRSYITQNNTLNTNEWQMCVRFIVSSSVLFFLSFQSFSLRLHTVVVIVVPQIRFIFQLTTAWVEVFKKSLYISVILVLLVFLGDCISFVSRKFTSGDFC